MFIDLTKEIKGFDGKVLKFEVAEEDAEGKPVAARKDLTMKTVMVKALTDEQTAKDGEEKFKRFKLASKIEDANDLVELSIDEVSKIKDLIGKIFTTIVVGRAYDIFENPVQMVDKTKEEVAA